MGAALIRVLAAIAVVVLMYVLPGYLMIRLTGRDQILRTSAPESAPLNLRIEGYDQTDVNEYWTWLGPDGRLVEQRFLQADLFFPFAYGGGLLAGLILCWLGLGRPFHPAWLVAPVAVTMLADWTENLIHLQQLRRFNAGEALQPDWIWIASAATSIKIGCFIVSAILFLFLCGWVLRNAFKSHQGPSVAPPAER